MNIAILGANSQIAKDTILSFSIQKEVDLFLFVRNKKALDQWISNLKLEKNCKVFEYSDFNNIQKFNVIINFVGASSPEKVKELGNDIIKVTEEFDEIAIQYIKRNKTTKYIFLSSGVVYASNYNEPVSQESHARINVNDLLPNEWYSLAKICAEVKHRSLSDLSIVDIRVFNYFSHTINMNSRFLITDIVRAIKTKEIFKTSSENIVRDYITPLDFNNLIQSIINYKPINIAVDCYTKAPIAKFDLLSKLKIAYGLDYSIDNSIKIVNATGSKKKYYSINTQAKIIGYCPFYDSYEGIIKEINETIS